MTRIKNKHQLWTESHPKKKRKKKKTCPDLASFYIITQQKSKPDCNVPHMRTGVSGGSIFFLGFFCKIKFKKKRRRRNSYLSIEATVLLQGDMMGPTKELKDLLIWHWAQTPGNIKHKWMYWGLITLSRNSLKPSFISYRYTVPGSM